MSTDDNTIPNDVRKAVCEMILYLEHDEGLHYFSCPKRRRKKHIFWHIKRAADYFMPGEIPDPLTAEPTQGV